MDNDSFDINSFLASRSLLFITLWPVSYLATWWIVISLVNSRQLPNGEIVGFLSILFGSAVLHRFLVERALRYSTLRWTRHTVLGLIITYVLFLIYLPSQPLSRSLTILVLFMPVPILQMAWLYGQVRSAWLWGLVSLGTSLVLIVSTPISMSPAETFLQASLPYGLIQGIVMRYLWFFPKNPEASRIKPIQADGTSEEHAAPL